MKCTKNSVRGSSNVQSTTMEAVGEYEYLPKDILGNGAFAVVYKGRRKDNPNKLVAIKNITKKSLAKTQALLSKEIKILQELTELHHENVVALFDCLESSHSVHLIMEYCEGGDLADYLKAHNDKLNEETIRLFLVQLADAMKALYVKGIVHRDLKPQNILISYKVPNPQPHEIKLKIADFGFARFLQEGNMAATLCGSPMYMAPEVIMSLKYDAKADLWSLGTIIFQCLTGKAPFQAQTPHALKHFYDKTPNLVPNIPPGTSPDLTDLLNSLLKRNAMERIGFEAFFNHRYFKRSVTPETPPSPPLNVPTRGSPSNTSNLLRRSSGSSFKGSTSSQQWSCEPESPRSTRITLSSSPEDDYVIVSRNIPDQCTESIEMDKQFKMTSKSPQPPMPCAPVANAVRPQFLPVSEPTPVPAMREAYMQMMSQTQGNKDNSKNAVNNGNNVPRSQPISCRSENRRPIHSDIDISSLSPPSVKFVIGTPPGGGRRRSTSGGSLCETPPPQCFWNNVSPLSVAKTAPVNAGFRGTGGGPPSPPMLSGPLARMPILSSPNLNNENNNQKYCPRTVTLPEISEMGNYQNMFRADSEDNNHPFMFLTPELPEETLLEKEHNDILAKLNFVVALTSCILNLASMRAAPLGGLMQDSTIQLKSQANGEVAKRAERFVLLVRALQFLGSALNFASKQMKEGQLRPSARVKHVMSTLNTKFRTTLAECKQLNSPEIMDKVPDITADKLLYDHVVQICQTAALDELFDQSQSCYNRYQTAQILLHSLTQQQQIPHQDKAVLIKYREAVEKRLTVLQEHGYATPEFDSSQ